MIYDDSIEGIKCWTVLTHVGPSNIQFGLAGVECDLQIPRVEYPEIKTKNKLDMFKPSKSTSQMVSSMILNVIVVAITHESFILQT